MDKHRAFQQLPAVQKLLEWPEAKQLAAMYPLKRVSAAIAQRIADLREYWDAAAPDDSAWQRLTDGADILKHAESILRGRFQPNLRPVLNLTGVLIHTNLGRSPLSARALAAVVAAGQGYSNLEYQIETGVRGSRHAHLEERLCALTGAEAAMVVNNNAAAVFLVLRELAASGEAIVSRGELVEIGGSFRIPSIMSESGVQLHEVGTTNKTRIADYTDAINEQTRLLLRVHPSNFRIVGFTERPTLAELCMLGERSGLPVYEDLGSGALMRLDVPQLADEPLVQDSIAAGVDVVSFSGDKLLGGAQAGIIVGKRHVIERLKRNQLARALRVDKLTLAALEATLIGLQDERLAKEEIPILRMLSEGVEAVRMRARAVLSEITQQLAGKAASLTLSLRDDHCQIGGGAMPETTLPTAVLEVTVKDVSAQALHDALRTIPDNPVVGRIQNNVLLLDMKTLLPGQTDALIEAMIQTLNVLLAKCD